MTSLQLDDQWLPLNQSADRMTSTVERDDITAAAVKPFDYVFTGRTEFRPAEIPNLPDDFGIGLIVGASGTGKSSLLFRFGSPTIPKWEPSRSIASHFASADDATNRLTAVGLSSVPTWAKPYDVLSNGEKFRADLARSIHDDAIIDEFTSVVDRNVAMAASKALNAWVNRNGTKRIVLATCHRDVIPWLRPDWIIDTDAQAYVLRPRECLHREPMVFRIHRARPDLWRYFAAHHYMSADLNKTSKCFALTVDDRLCGFCAVLPLPHHSIRNGHRTHRLVVIPDFQGFGIGPRFHDWVGKLYASQGATLYIKTVHPRFGEYLTDSHLWTATLSNRRPNNQTDESRTAADRKKYSSRQLRVSYSFRFAGVDAEHRRVDRKLRAPEPPSLFDAEAA